MYLVKRKNLLNESENGRKRFFSLTEYSWMNFIYDPLSIRRATQRKRLFALAMLIAFLLTLKTEELECYYDFLVTESEDEMAGLTMTPLSQIYQCLSCFFYGFMQFSMDIDSLNFNEKAVEQTIFRCHKKAWESAPSEDFISHTVSLVSEEVGLIPIRE